MSGRKNALSPYQIFDDADMNQVAALGQTLVSPVTSIQFLDNVGLQLQFIGNPEGNFNVQVSLDYQFDVVANTLVNPGTWITLSLSPSPVAEGVADQIYIDLNQLSAPWIRVQYENTMHESGTITTVADNEGSLNSTYFLIDGADTNLWYVWFDNGTGVDPAVPDRTGIQVTYTDNDTANTIATLLRTALVACVSIGTIGGSNAEVTFSQTQAGPGDLTDGADPTGFDFEYNANNGVLNGYITAKMI